MKPTVPVLVCLLVASNAAWWLVMPAAAPANASPAAPPPAPAADAERERLAAELQQARTRIAELERAPARTAAPPAATAKDAVDPAREAAAALAQRNQKSTALSKQWVDAALQTLDPAARTRALDAIRQALQGGDPAEVVAALRALARLRELDYDKAAFRELVEPQLRSPDAAARAAALYALYNTAPRPEDVATLLGMVGDPSPEVRSKLAHVLTMNCQGRLAGEPADAVLRLLQDGDAEVRRGALTTLSGAEVDERIAAHYLALAADREQRHDAFYFGLSTFAKKSPAVVDALVQALDDADSQLAERAAWGLGQGVEGPAQATVADAFLRQLESRSGNAATERALNMLQRYGSARHVPALETYAARPALAAAQRQRVEQVIAQLRTR